MHRVRCECHCGDVLQKCVKSKGSYVLTSLFSCYDFSCTWSCCTSLYTLLSRLMWLSSSCLHLHRKSIYKPALKLQFVIFTLLVLYKLNKQDLTCCWSPFQLYLHFIFTFSYISRPKTSSTDKISTLDYRVSKHVHFFLNRYLANMSQQLFLKNQSLYTVCRKK